jgi:hypothetical protein
MGGLFFDFVEGKVDLQHFFISFQHQVIQFKQCHYLNLPIFLTDVFDF